MADGRRRHEAYSQRRARRAEVEDPEVVRAAALRFLEARPRSVAETRRRLTDAGYRPELVTGAIDRLLGLGLLDDEAFARAWIESRDRARPRGAVALRRELRLRGVTDDVINATLLERDGAAAGSAAAADEAAAHRLLERQSAALARVVDPQARRRRAYALLARNGFDPEVCARLSAMVGGT